MKNRFGLKPMSALFATVLAATALAGCGTDPTDPTGGVGGDLCCTEFKVGADLTGVDWGLDADVNAKFSAFAQASADLSAVATGSLNDVAIACQNLAIELGADPEDSSVAGKSGADAVSAWCTLAAGTLTATFGANAEVKGSFSVEFEPPKCTASVSATADCQASCSGSAECDLNANPPKCEGGKLSVQCSGSCEASAETPSVKCTGSCSGNCSGSCKAEAGATVTCEGKCDGTCTAAAGGGTMDGIQADGSCKGECDGTCEMAADAMVQCSGTCEGSCDATCEAQPGGVSAECDGTCMGEASAPKCEGGTLELNCSADVDCNGNCNASASAKAECTPPSVAVSFEATGTLDVEAQAKVDLAIASLEAHLPNLLLVIKARGTAFVDTLGVVVESGASISGDVAGGGSVKAVACAAAVVGVITEASANFKASLDASLKVTGAVGI